jgi:hypothetical protein
MATWMSERHPVDQGSTVKAAVMLARAIQLPSPVCVIRAEGVAFAEYGVLESLVVALVENCLFGWRDRLRDVESHWLSSNLRSLHWSDSFSLERRSL